MKEQDRQAVYKRFDALEKTLAPTELLMFIHFMVGWAPDGAAMAIGKIEEMRASMRTAGMEAARRDPYAGPCVCGHPWLEHSTAGCAHQARSGGPFCKCTTAVL